MVATWKKKGAILSLKKINFKLYKVTKGLQHINNGKNFKKISQRLKEREELVHTFGGFTSNCKKWVLLDSPWTPLHYISNWKEKALILWLESYNEEKNF